VESGVLQVVLCGNNVHGYGWVFPMGRGLFNVGIGFALRNSPSRKVNLYSGLEMFLETLPKAQELLSAAETRSPWSGHPLRCALTGAPPLLGERVIAAGEAIGTTYPFSGEGIGKAMESGELAARAVSAALQNGDPKLLNLYGNAIDRELRPKYKGYLIAEKWLASRWRSELFIHVAKRSVRLRRNIKAILEETSNPTTVFSAGGLLKSLLGK
jgi:flavin-dependent dehydrogenase